MNIVSSRVDDVITLTISGRIDTTTASCLQNEILSNFQKTNKMILDFTSVDYISSVGLRALLLGQKTAMSKGGVMRIRNVSSTVKNVFEMTGFIDILTIE